MTSVPQQEVRTFLEHTTGTEPPALADTSILRVYLSGIESTIAGARADILHSMSGQHNQVDAILKGAEEALHELQELQKDISSISFESIQARLEGGILQVCHALANRLMAPLPFIGIDHARRAAT